MAKTSKKAPVPEMPERKPLLSRGVRRALVHSLVAVTLVSSVGTGLWALRRHVARDLVYDNHPPRVVLTNRPAWMSDFLATQIIRSVRPRGGTSAIDKAVIEETYSALSANPWVDRVNHVRRAFGERPGDTIEIDCDFRVPVALVKGGLYYWLVDVNGVKLPDQYSPDLVPKVVLDDRGQTQLRIIEGVKSPPPESGEKWAGDDVRAGIELARLIFAEPFANEIIKIDVANFAGRVDGREAQIVFVTRWDTQVRWGRPANATDYIIEAPTSTKLANLRAVRQTYGRVDARQPWIDVRFDQPTYPVSVSPPHGQGAAQADVGR
jgi:hypothetical protein